MSLPELHRHYQYAFLFSTFDGEVSNGGQVEAQMSTLLSRSVAQ